jgi:hypothetical protein
MKHPYIALQIAMLAAIPFAGLAAWPMDRAQGAGTMLGCTAATAIGVASIAWQERLLRTRPSLAMNAMVVGFLAKLLALLAGALALRYVEPLAVWASWSSYLLAFAAATLWVMTIGSLRHFKVMRAGPEHRVSKEPSAS